MALAIYFRTMNLIRSLRPLALIAALTLAGAQSDALAAGHAPKAPRAAKVQKVKSARKNNKAKSKKKKKPAHRRGSKPSRTRPAR